MEKTFASASTANLSHHPHDDKNLPSTSTRSTPHKPVGFFGQTAGLFLFCSGVGGRRDWCKRSWRVGNAPASAL